MQYAYSAFPTIPLLTHILSAITSHFCISLQCQAVSALQAWPLFGTENTSDKSVTVHLSASITHRIYLMMFAEAGTLFVNSLAITIPLGLLCLVKQI
jgi:hypothetical protein